MSIRGRLRGRKKTRITKYSESELRERLTPEQYRVLHEGGTEAPFSGEYREVETEGTYRCRVCDAALFSSDTKFDPNGAWPAFRAPLDTPWASAVNGVLVFPAPSRCAPIAERTSATSSQTAKVGPKPVTASTPRLYA